MVFHGLLAPGSRAGGQARGGQHSLPTPGVSPEPGLPVLPYAGDERRGSQLEGKHSNETSVT